MTIDQMERVAKLMGIKMELSLAIRYATWEDWQLKRNPTGRYTYTFSYGDNSLLFEFPDTDSMTLKSFYRQMYQIRREASHERKLVR